MTRSLAIERTDAGVRVNCVAPGFTETPMTEAFFADPQLSAALRRRIPLGRVLTAVEIAHAAVFLASPAASGVTGVVFPVDGGYAAGSGVVIAPPCLAGARPVGEDVEAFAGRGEGEPVVERHEVERRGPVLAGGECSRELKRVSGAEVVDSNEPSRNLADAVGWGHLRPAGGKLRKVGQRTRGVPRIHGARSLPPGDGRRALERRSPPDEWLRVVRE